MSGYDAINFIPKEDVPTNKKVTHTHICCDFRSKKTNPNQTRITTGSDRLDYDDHTYTGISSLETVKMHLNSVISTKNAKYANADMGNMHKNS